MEYMPGILNADSSNALATAIEEHFEEHRFGLWAIEVNAGPSFIGYTGLQRCSFLEQSGPCVEIAWRLTRDAWGYGYATEAARAACHVAFAELQLSELVSYTTTANTRSRRVMERIGMIHAQHEDFDHPRLPDGHPLRRHVLYRLSLDEWLGARTSS
jgi:RimJ/RimL family protein N-acetyltransferase